MNAGFGLPFYPFDPQRSVGTVSQVGPSSAKVNLPQAGQATGRLHHGHRIGGGEVGEFVVVECDEVAIFGRIVEVRLPERERLGVETELGRDRDVHPLGTVQFLASIDLASGDVLPGVSRHPRLGNRVYAAHPDLARWLIERTWRMRHDKAGVTLNMATLPDMEDATVGMTAEQLFGRHCAVLGSTGGGKSWTVARLIEEALKFESKVILLDATGEFHSMSDAAVKHVHIGAAPEPEKGSTESSFPYTSLTESDLFAILKPSGQTQGPKLRAAMKSLKLVRIEPLLATNGLLIKANKLKKPVEDAYRKHVAVVEGPAADF
ncbi:MAG: ATP-binding protein, partial [Planctomycetes bacterium]|nr:ATP-binding protein [Planctomycetota bacterium]